MWDGITRKDSFQQLLDNFERDLNQIRDQKMVTLEKKHNKNDELDEEMIEKIKRIKHDQAFQN